MGERQQKSPKMKHLGEKVGERARARVEFTERHN